MTTTIPPVTAGLRQDTEARRIAFIGESVTIKGQIFSREDLRIDGTLEGSIELPGHKLTVGKTGKILANVKANEVIIQGTVQGNVEASDRIEIQKDSQLIGDIRSARIAIEDGGYLKGKIDVVKLGTSPAAAADRAARASVSSSSGNGVASAVSENVAVPAAV